MDSERYSVTDLLKNDAFLSWVKNPTPELDAYWTAWRGNDKVKTELIDHAKKIILSIDFKKNHSHEVDDQKILNRIKSTIQQDREKLSHSYPLEETLSKRKSDVKAPTNNKSFLSGWQKAAAVFIGVAVCTLILLMHKKSHTRTFVTDYGETKVIALPDHSQVKLNGNSKLFFSTEWKNKELREVWLEGEAYFSVNPTVSDQKFVVYTSDRFNVEVLGTEFNVSNRKGKTSVVLSSGKIKLNVEKNNQIERMVMEPGEMVEYGNTDPILRKKEVDPQKYTSWTKNKLIFDNTSLEEIKYILETTYGLTVEVTDEALLDQKVFGSAPSNNIRLLLQGLAKSLDRKITYKNNHVKIAYKNN